MYLGCTATYAFSSISGQEQDGWVTGAQGAITWSREPAAKNGLDLVMADAKVTPRWSDGDFNRAFGLADEEPFVGAHSSLIDGIENLLSYDLSSVRLVLPAASSSFWNGANDR